MILIDLSGNRVKMIIFHYIYSFHLLCRGSKWTICPLNSPTAATIFLYGLVCSPDIFHSLCKFADMIEIVADFDVIWVNISANTLLRLIIQIANPNGATIRKIEQVIITGIYEADTLLSALQMAVYPIFSVAIAIQVILAFIRIQAHQEGVMLGIHPHAVLPAVGILESIAHLVAEVLHIAPPVKKFVFLAEIVNHRIKLCFELVRVVVGTKFVPSVEKSIVR